MLCRWKIFFNISFFSPSFFLWVTLFQLLHLEMKNNIFSVCKWKWRASLFVYTAARSDVVTQTHLNTHFNARFKHMPNTILLQSNITGHTLLQGLRGPETWEDLSMEQPESLVHSFADWLQQNLPVFFALVGTENRWWCWLYALLQVTGFYGNLAAVQLMVECRQEWINSRDSLGFHPLHLVLSSQYPQNKSACLKYLLDHMADVNA